ncbi:hypothetical protein S2M10_06820 [Sphingomonas sp. S2M10]|uniref:DUF2190 family protein n=1 Tax=Sphingomonas sp. S2M10 TaxID=2705010 RepID=UPI001457171E|nr:DUF2190 family protein [Sphingomonas sp. S2M10]NLS25712.1 hypothetical protein [Sphingomonas sp. S2M10]
MKNFVQNGDNITGVAPYAVASGQGYLDGAEFAVASADAASGAPVVGVVRGVFTLPKAAVAITRKTVAYWDNTNRVVTNVATNNIKIGIFMGAATSGAASIDVRLVPVI